MMKAFYFIQFFQDIKHRTPFASFVFGLLIFFTTLRLTVFRNFMRLKEKLFMFFVLVFSLIFLFLSQLFYIYKITTE